MDTKSQELVKTNSLFSKYLPVTLVVLTGALYFPTLADLYSRWIKWDEGLSHGLVVVFAFLFFLLKDSPFGGIPTTFTRIFFCLALSITSLTWFASHAVNIQIVEQISLLLITILLFAALFGYTAVKQNILLFAFPIFAIPIWDQLNDLLVNWSSAVVGYLVKTINMPALIDGNSIFIPSGEIVIADGCSGLRYFTISLAIGYVVSYLNGYIGRKLIATLAIAVLIGLFTNWLRIFLLVIIGHETNMQSSLMSDHEYFGWILFVLAAAPALYFAPVVTRSPPPSKPISQSVYHYIVPIGLLTLGPAMSAMLDTEPKTQSLRAIINSSYTPVLEKSMPLQVNSPVSTRIENAMDSNKVYIQVNQYQRVNREQKLVPYLKRLYNSEQWSITQEYETTVESSRIKIQIFRNKHNGTIVAQAQWFAIAGITVNSYSVAKLMQIPAILGNQNVFTIYSLQSVCSDSSCTAEIQYIIARSSALIKPL